MYAYSANDPLSDADISFSNNPHGSKPVYLMHRSQFADDQLPSDVKVWDLRNYQVNLELGIFFSINYDRLERLDDFESQDL